MKTFIHNFKYTGLSLLKAKTSILWTLLFPIALATFMYFAFGNLFEADEVFSSIDVAAVDSESDDTLMEVLKELDASEDNKLINLKIMTREEAEEALSDDEIIGIIEVKDASLVVKESSFKAQILESVLKQYKQQKQVMTDIAVSHPEKLDDAIATLTETSANYTEVSTSDGNQDAYTQYFYAILAMSCLFASFSTVATSLRMLANSSPEGMRKSLTATNKAVLITSEFAVLLIVHFIVEVLALLYMKLLGVDFGDKYGAILLALFFGCMIGLALGVIIGSIQKIKPGTRQGIAVAVGMVLSVLADLCVGGIKDLVQHTVPILNKINPAVLLTDCLYSLNVYDNYDRFFTNIAIMAVESVIFVVIGFLMVRREKYASI